MGRNIEAIAQFTPPKLISDTEFRWCLDVTFGEDQSRVREHQLRENFAGLNRLALSLLKQHPGRQSVAMKRRSCGWSDQFLMDVVTTSTC